MNPYSMVLALHTHPTLMCGEEALSQPGCTNRLAIECMINPQAVEDWIEAVRAAIKAREEREAEERRAIKAGQKIRAKREARAKTDSQSNHDYSVTQKKMHQREGSKAELRLQNALKNGDLNYALALAKGSKFKSDVLMKAIENKKIRRALEIIKLTSALLPK